GSTRRLTPPAPRTTQDPAPAASYSGPGPAHGDLRDQQRRLAHAHRHALAVLAAGAHALVQRQVVANHRHPLHGLRPVADQGRALDRRGDAAVLDQVGLGRREHVFAAGDVDLAATEVHRVQALLHRADHLLALVRPGQHVGVGHARHYQVRERLATAVAGRCHAHQARVERVLHVAGEHTVLDQRGALRGRALVVDAERAAAAVQGAVVDDGDAGRGHALAHASGVGAGALAVEVALESVA